MNKREKLLWNLLVGVSIFLLIYIYYCLFAGSDSYYFQSKKFQSNLNEKIKDKQNINKNFDIQVNRLNNMLELRADKIFKYFNNPMNPMKIIATEGSNAEKMKRGIICNGVYEDNGAITSFCEYSGELYSVELNDKIGSGGTITELDTKKIVITFNDGTEPIEFEFWK